MNVEISYVIGIIVGLLMAHPVVKWEGRRAAKKLAGDIAAIDREDADIRRADVDRMRRALAEARR